MSNPKEMEAILSRTDQVWTVPRSMWSQKTKHKKIGSHFDQQMVKQSRIGSHFEQKLPNNDCICCIYGQSDKTDKELETGQLFIQFLGGSSGPEQINQLRTSSFWLICKRAS